MRLPFSSEQFFDVFKLYNETLFPSQIILFLLALFVLFLSRKQDARAGALISGILALFFLWMGIVYHLMYFAKINGAARIFGALFIVQAFLLVYYGIMKKKIFFRATTSVYGVTGWMFITYALAVYPLIGYLQGHLYPSSPTFGLPCPTIIFTLGIFLWSVPPFPKLLLIIPFIWTIIGFSAAFLLGVKEDMALLPAGLIAVILIIIRDRSVSMQSRKA